MRHIVACLAVCLSFAAATPSIAIAQPLQPSLMEPLGRGVVALRSTTTDVVIGWRVLGTDPPDVSFNLYRATGGGAPVKLNATPVTGATQFVDTSADLTQLNAYSVRAIIHGLEQPAGPPFVLEANAAAISMATANTN
jgi:hypothetical protein